jgi:non-heme chloroperoxidase
MIKFIRLPNRLAFPYVEQGTPGGVPLILLHGYTDSWRSFEPMLPYLPPSLHAFALSLRGHGDADRPQAGYRPRDFAEDVVAFMDARGLRAAVIVGHSMGSLIAQRIALDYPERVLGLVLVGSAASLRRFSGIQELWDSISHLTDPIDRQFVMDFQKSTLARPVPEAFLGTVVRESLKAPARVWRAALEGHLEDDSSGEVRRIKAPTLILWGDEDGFCPRGEQAALAGAIAASRLVVYSGAGHALHWEEPQRFAADLKAFAAQWRN